MGACDYELHLVMTNGEPMVLRFEAETLDLAWEKVTDLFFEGRYRHVEKLLNLTVIREQEAKKLKK